MGGRKIFLYNPKAIEESLAETVAASLIVTVIFFVLPALFFIDNDEKEEAVKKVTLTVTDRVEKETTGLLRFSDGFTQKFHLSIGDEEWRIVKKGDKIQKLIYSNGECEYTPVFDEPPISE